MINIRFILILIIGIISFSITTESVYVWSMTGGNAAHTYHANFNSPSAVNWKIETKTNNSALFNVAVWNNLVYITFSNRIQAYNTNNGSLIWDQMLLGRYDVNNGGSLAVGMNSIVYVVNRADFNSSNLTAIDGQTGTIKWKKSAQQFYRHHFIDPCYFTDPVIDLIRNVVYVFCNDRLLGFNGDDGSINWQFQLNEDMADSPAPTIDHDQIIIFYDSDNIYAINLDTKVITWKLNNPILETSYLPVYQNRVYVQVSNSILILDLLTGKRLNEFLVPDNSLSISNLLPINDHLAYIPTTSGLVQYNIITGKSLISIDYLDALIYLINNQSSIYSYCHNNDYSKYGLCTIDGNIGKTSNIFEFPINYNNLAPDIDGNMIILGTDGSLSSIS